MNYLLFLMTIFVSCLKCNTLKFFWRKNKQQTMTIIFKGKELSKNQEKNLRKKEFLTLHGNYYLLTNLT